MRFYKFVQFTTSVTMSASLTYPHFPQAYGYEYLPLLLSLAAPSLGVLLPNPLPPSTPSIVAGLKYPFVQLRKSLRLLIDDNPEALDEVENDISFVYSGYAPISVRLVQCVAQKGGVISNPAEKEKTSVDASSAADPKKTSMGKVQAHPIVGWKGFEDVISAIPGQTVEITQSASSKVSPSVTGEDFQPTGSPFVWVANLIFCRVRTRDDYSCVLFGRLYIHRDRSSSMGRAPEQR